MHVRASICGAMLVVTTAIGSALGAPKEPTAAERKEAKALADEGLALYGKGDYTGAVDRLGRAEAFVPLPTITLQRARALERLGRWVEAKAAYKQVAGTALPWTAPPVHKRAVTEAQKDLEALEPRIPRISVALVPTMREGDAITIDGRALTDPRAPFFEVDPGEHVVEVTRSDGIQARTTVTLGAAERRAIELTVARPPPAPPVSPAPPESDMPALELAGWIGIGVGGSALVVAMATGIPAIDMKGDLEARCPAGRCPPDVFDDLSKYDALRWSAGITLVVGIVLAGAGGTAVAWSRATETDPAAPSVEALIGPSSAGARVRF